MLISAPRRENTPSNKGEYPMATTTPKELTKSTYITFKPAYKDCNLSPIDLARIAASADGYTVHKNEEGTGWDMRFITHEGIPLPTPMKTGTIEGHITDVTTEGGATDTEILEYIQNSGQYAPVFPDSRSINYDTGYVTFAFKGIEQDFGIFFL